MSTKKKAGQQSSGNTQKGKTPPKPAIAANKAINKQVSKPAIDVMPQPVLNPAAGWSLVNFRSQAIIIALLGFLFYCNSFSNENAHDDGISIVKNEYVQQGFAGIPSIMTTDAYDSYYRQMNSANQLSGGRYRPLSFVTFAIEQQFFGAHSEKELNETKGKNVDGTIAIDMKKLIPQMHVRHVINVLFFILSTLVLLYFLRTIVFPNDSIIALLAAVLFTIHPIHTEVVANVKSRDEILSLLFMGLTFIFAWRYKDDNKKATLALALGCYFLALLSKEYAVTMLVLIPLMFYLFRNYTVSKSITSVLPYVAVFALYFLLRHHYVGVDKSENSDAEVLNNPYLFASDVEKLATEIATTLNYLKLLIFPHPLSSDYSYDQIPYKDFSNIWVWTSIVVHVGMIVAFFKLLKTRHVLAFAIAFYLVHLFLVCNIIFDIGATMGERLIYHSSFGFAIAAGWLLYKGAEKINPVSIRRGSLAAAMVVITVLCGFKTIQRNAQWKNDTTLFLTDVHTVPNSVLANGNAAVCLSNVADAETDTAKRAQELHTAIGYLDKAISLHPKFVAGYVNRGLMYYKLNNIAMAKANWDSVRKYYPTYPTLPSLYTMLASYFINIGWNQYGKAGRYNEAIAVFQQGLQMLPDNPDLWYNLGGSYFSMKDYPKAYEAWTRTLQLRPDHPQALQGMQALKPIMGIK